MTDKNLIKLLHNLNKKWNSKNKFSYRVGANVDLVKVWGFIKSDGRMKPCDTPDTYYVIKDDENFAAGVVYVMSNDLHWLVLPRFRKKGLLTQALKYSILPHISRTRDTQQISINQKAIGMKNFEASCRVAENIGFKKMSDQDNDKYSLDLREFSSVELQFENKVALTEDEIGILQNKIDKIVRELGMIKTQLEVSFWDTEYIEDFDSLLGTLSSQKYSIENLWWKEKISLCSL